MDLFNTIIRKHGKKIPISLSLVEPMSFRTKLVDTNDQDYKPAVHFSLF